MISKMKGLTEKQKLTIMIVIAFFVVSLVLLIKNISQVRKINADITSLTIKENIIVLNVNNTKQSLINKIGTSNISVLSDGVELDENTKIATGNILRYNNQDYQIAVLGDPNKDSIVTGSDVSQVYSAYTKAIQLSKVQFIAADYNGDGVLTGSDVSAVYSLYKNPPQEEGIEVFTINFDSTGGTNVGSIIKNAGEEIGDLPLSIKDGYTFDGWYTQSIGGTKITPSTKVSENITYYAHWNINNYNITYNLNGGQATNINTYNIETESFTLNNPIKEGYTFKGWTGTGLIGSDNKEVTIQKGSIGDRQYTAIWNEDNYYTINFDSTGGTSVSSITRKGNQEIGTLPEPTKEGYEFEGWYTNPDIGEKIYSTTKVTANVTYYAQWITNTYTINYDANGGSGTTDSQLVEYNNTFQIKDNSFTKENYIFEKWNTNKDGSGTSYYEKQQVNNLTTENNKTITLYAIWKEKTKEKVNPITNLKVSTSGIVSWSPSSNATGYQISIDASNWTSMPSTQTSYNYFNTIITTIGTRTIYVKAINNDFNNYEDSSIVSKTINVYTLTVNSNNTNYGTVDKPSLKVIGGETFTTSSNNLSLSDGRKVTANKIDTTGYTTTFTSWSSTTGTITANTTITANFKRENNLYIVVFDANGGSGTTTSALRYNESLGTLPTATIAGGTFDGWYTSKTGGTKVSSSTKVTGNVTYYAHYTYKDQIHFLNVGTSDAILIESQGKFGLIDASNPDMDTTIRPPDVGPVNNGIKVYNYLQKLGVTHLDFIMASHHHSDHIGGIPSLVDAHKNVISSSLCDSNGCVNDGYDLIDSSTVFIYKDNFNNEYPTASYGEVTEGVWQEWKNKDYFNSAKANLTQEGVLMLDTRYHTGSGMTKLNANFTNDSNKRDQYITFNFGNYNFKIYNLYNNTFYSTVGSSSSYLTTDENTNSLVTLITTNNSKKILLMGDMNVRDGFEQHYGNLIKKVDILKANHHGYHYSNSKGLIDSTNPSYVIVSSAENILNPDTDTTKSQFGAARLYLKNRGTKVYQTINSNDAYVVQFNGSNITVNNVYTSNNNIVLSSNVTELASNLSDGWYSWYNTNDTKLDYYIQNNSFQKSKYIAYGSEYCWMNSDGSWNGYYYNFTQSGGNWFFKRTDNGYTAKSEWLTLSNKTYYFNSSGVMVTGKQNINGVYYFFDSSGVWQSSQGWINDGGAYYYANKDGALVTGWQQIDSKWYYFDSNRVMLKGWQQINNNWYYLDASGVMQTGWQKISGVNYYFNSSGIMQTGWQTINGKQYYLYTSAMIKCSQKLGQMAYSEYIDGKWLGSDGAYTGETGEWTQDSGGWWYKYSSGSYPKNTTLWINGKAYDFDSNGYASNSNGYCK